MEHKSPGVWHIPSGETGPPFQMFNKVTRKAVFHLLFVVVNNECLLLFLVSLSDTVSVTLI